MNHFLKETDFKSYEIAEIFSLAASFKKQRNRHTPPTLKKQSWGLLFFKKSTRTRISFEVGIRELEGTPIILNSADLQLSHGESLDDTVRVLSRYLHGLIIRTHEHENIEAIAQASTIPVINALTALLHPCQTYTDAFTLAERWGQEPSLSSLEGRKLAFIGDTASNMAHSWLLGGALFGMNIALSGPSGFEPDKALDTLIEQAGLTKAATFTTDPMAAVQNADVIYTDVWVSMGDEATASMRIEKLKPYAVTPKILSAAKPDAYFMHCMPVHPREEVSPDILDKPNCLIYEQAENRLHVQKAILSILSSRAR